MSIQIKTRVLAIALSTRGFGYAVMEGPNALVGYGRKSVEGDKNAKCLAQVQKLAAFFRPDVLVLQNMRAKGCRRAPRIKDLNQRIIEIAKKQKLKVTLVSTDQIKAAFPADPSGTEYGRAKILAERFPNDLGLRLPAKRRAQDNEDARMDIFDAVALAFYSLKGENTEA